jgi:hypothetical protein
LSVLLASFIGLAVGVLIGRHLERSSWILRAGGTHPARGKFYRVQEEDQVSIKCTEREKGPCLDQELGIRFGMLPQRNRTLAAFSITDEVARLEEIARDHEGCQCGEVRATLLVNFGPAGRVAKLVKQDMGVFEMLMTVLRHYYDADAELDRDEGGESP